MEVKERILKAIYLAIDEVNMQLSDSEQLDKTPDTILLGEGGTLDSLAVVNLIVMTEEFIEDEFNKTLNIADQDISSMKGNPFRNVNTMADYIAARLDETSL